MRVLIVKTSSLGDIVHTFPALTDAINFNPNIQFDWLVEEAFAELPQLHPAVSQVKTIGLRRWRKNWGKAWKSGGIKKYLQALRDTRYDLVIDAQGLIKSALSTALAKGPAVGYDRNSLKERVACLFYRHRYHVDFNAHAIWRNRELFSRALGYRLTKHQPIDYGLRVVSSSKNEETTAPYVVFLHATTWASKHWPALYWAELAHIATESGYVVKLPWGSPEERLNAEGIIHQANCGELLPKQALSEMALTLGNASGVVGVDTGLSHMAAALNIPAVAIYGSTNVALTGAQGPKLSLLKSEFKCAPCMKKDCNYEGEALHNPACYEEISPQRVWSELQIPSLLLGEK